jgi:hypothetical protein
MRHRALSEQEKLNLQIPLNIWDAAKAYRQTHGDTRSLRVILKDPEFSNAWRTFRGGAGGGTRWFDLTPSQRRDRLRRGYVPTSFEEKMEAARVIGWAPNRNMAIDRLRNVSP